MIARISGTVIGTNDKYILIEAGGITYRIFATAETLVKYGNHGRSGIHHSDTHHNESTRQATLWTAHIIREDAQELFGFETIADHDLFELLRSVSGIGPRSALAVMNVATIGTIARAIHTNDVGYLTKISGIGKKTAEKIILELRDKIPAEYSENNSPSSHDVIDALIALGYHEGEAREALRTLDPQLDTQSKIREALKKINKK